MERVNENSDYIEAPQQPLEEMADVREMSEEISERPAFEVLEREPDTGFPGPRMFMMPDPLRTGLITSQILKETHRRKDSKEKPSEEESSR
jgi:hypothetical protein